MTLSTKRPCGRPSCDGCPLKLQCEHVCGNPRCLNPSHHHPEPSVLQRAFFGLPAQDVALWALLMASKMVEGEEPWRASTIVYAALQALHRADRGDEAVVSLVRDADPVAAAMLDGRYDDARKGLESLLLDRMERAEAIDAVLTEADLGVAA